MISPDSCLHPDTRNLFGISGNVFEDLPAPSEPPAVFFGNSRSSASAQCEPVSLNPGRLANRSNEMERNIQIVAIHTEIRKEFVNLKIRPSHAEGTCPQNCIVEQPKNQVSEMHFNTFPDPPHFSVGKRVLRPRYVPVQTFPRTLCCGSQKCRWSTPWTISRRHGQLEGTDSRFFEMLHANIASALKKIITNPHFKKRVNLKQQEDTNARPIFPCKTDCVRDLRILPSDCT